MRSNPVFLEIAVLAFCSDHDLKPLDDLIQRKYRYLAKYRDTDLFSLPADQAQRMHQWVTALEKEVAILYAAKCMTIRQRELYMNATADIGETIHKERQDLLNQTQYRRGRYEQEHTECMREKADGLFWIEQAQKYLRHGTAK